MAVAAAGYDIQVIEAHQDGDTFELRAQVWYYASPQLVLRFWARALTPNPALAFSWRVTRRELGDTLVLEGELLYGPIVVAANYLRVVRDPEIGNSHQLGGHRVEPTVPLEWGQEVT